MAIKGLTDRVVPAFPRLGKLRKGGERPSSGNRPGKELPHWRFVAENPAVLEAFEAAYGAAPTELDVYLPYASIEDNFQAWQEEWVAGGLKHRCDGETCVLWLADDGTYSQRPVPCPGGCKPVGRLNVILPALLRAGHVGYVTMETHSINDIAGLQGTLLAVAEARGTEDMRGIGFCLRRVQRQISTPSGGGKRARRNKWMVELVPAAQWVTAQLQVSQETAMGALPSPGGPDPDEAPDEEGQDDGETIEGQVMQVDKGNGKAPAPKFPPRPWGAEDARRAILAKVQHINDDSAATGEFRNFVAGRMNDLFDADPTTKNAKRHSVLLYLFGIDTSAKLTKGQCKALRAWCVDETKDNDGQTILLPNEHAIQEAAAMAKAYEAGAGQQEMGL